MKFDYTRHCTILGYVQYDVLTTHKLACSIIFTQLGKLNLWFTDLRWVKRTPSLRRAGGLGVPSARRLTGPRQRFRRGRSRRARNKSFRVYCFL